ncbi:hypothetical protein HanIR_Chr09g0417011 [Helianthus annuus]|nr:hypothetical protein HanIR_Chr09g0417011 [Helianthus annuus]
MLVKLEFFTRKYHIGCNIFITLYLCSTGTPFMWPYPSRVLVGDGNTMGTRRGRFLDVSNVRDVSGRSI